MSIGFAGTKYSTFFEKIGPQDGSFTAFNANFLTPYKKAHTKAEADFDEVILVFEQYFGLKYSELADIALCGDAPVHRLPPPETDPVVLRGNLPRLLRGDDGCGHGRGRRHAGGTGRQPQAAPPATGGIRLRGWPGGDRHNDHDSPSGLLRRLHGPAHGLHGPGNSHSQRPEHHLRFGRDPAYPGRKPWRCAGRPPPRHWSAESCLPPRVRPRAARCCFSALFDAPAAPRGRPGQTSLEPQGYVDQPDERGHFN
jgi:hypothetical protein